jgi:2-oxoisovalerate dehydrogenase E2 component (dihydrolipoyl transacylase)
VQHLTYCEEIAFDKIKKLRHDLKKQAASKGIKISYMPILIKATSLALTQFPSLNATVNSDVSEMIYHANHNIGVAIDTPKGLVVPVIKEVQKKSIFEIAAALNELQEAGSNGTLTEAQLSGGTFSLSNIGTHCSFFGFLFKTYTNLGSIGGTYAVPVLVVPQVVIGAFGRLQVLPRYTDKDGNSASMELIDRYDTFLLLSFRGANILLFCY